MDIFSRRIVSLYRDLRGDVTDRNADHLSNGGNDLDGNACPQSCDRKKIAAVVDIYGFACGSGGVIATGQRSFSRRDRFDPCNFRLVSANGKPAKISRTVRAGHLERRCLFSRFYFGSYALDDPQ